MMSHSNTEYNSYLPKIFFVFIFIYFINFLFIDIYNWYSVDNITLFFNRSDIHADAIKAALSLKDIIGDATNMPSFSSWPAVFQNYVVGYADYKGIGSSGTIYHHPPLTFFYFEIVAFSIRAGISPTLILLTLTSFVILLFSVISLKIKKNFNFSNNNYIYLFLIFLLSYPFIFALNRANYPSIFSFLFIYYWIFSKDRNIRFLPLALTLNIRPNIILAALPFIKFDNKSYKYVFFIFIQTLFIFLFFLFLSSYLNYKYNFESFTSSLSEYNKAYIFMGAGDAYNSSLHSLSRFFSITIGVKYKITYFSYIIIYLIFVLYSFLFFNLNNTVKSFIGASACMVLTPVFADYHLLIFLIPLTYSIIEYNDNPRLCNIVGLIVIFLISPKFNFFINGFTPNTFINPLLVLSCFFLIYKHAQPRVYNLKFSTLSKDKFEK